MNKEERLLEGLNLTRIDRFIKIRIACQKEGIPEPPSIAKAIEQTQKFRNIFLYNLIQLILNDT